MDDRLRQMMHLGVTYYSLGRKSEARAEWQSVLNDDPGNKSAKMYLEISADK